MDFGITVPLSPSRGWKSQSTGFVPMGCKSLWVSEALCPLEKEEGGAALGLPLPIQAVQRALWLIRQLGQSRPKGAGPTSEHGMTSMDLRLLFPRNLPVLLWNPPPFILPSPVSFICSV